MMNPIRAVTDFINTLGLHHSGIRRDDILVETGDDRIHHIISDTEFDDHGRMRAQFIPRETGPDYIAHYAIWWEPEWTAQEFITEFSHDFLHELCHWANEDRNEGRAESEQEAREHSRGWESVLFPIVEETVGTNPAEVREKYDE